LKTLAIVIHTIVPHAADVERLFSDLGGTQSVKHCNLSVETFETLGKLRNNYSYHLYQKDRAAGKPIHHRHAHMHTRKDPGIDTELAKELESTFAWVPPLATPAEYADDYLQGPESISLDEIEDAFKELEKDVEMEIMDEAMHGGEVLEGNVYDFEELERVDKGLVLAALDEEISLIDRGGDKSWDAHELMSAVGVSSN
jgi:hypothetical protein